MCQNSTDSQKPLSGAWAKVHGQGTAQLQLSNQSPRICQLGMWLIWALQSNRRRWIIAGLAALWGVKRPITAEPGTDQTADEHVLPCPRSSDQRRRSQNRRFKSISGRNRRPIV